MEHRLNEIKNIRNSNLELYRIITMLLIVAHHYVVNSGLAYQDGPMVIEPDNINTLYLWAFGMWGKTGINCFLMITGYFMCKSQITLRKFLKLMLQIYLYKVAIYIIFLLSGYECLTMASVTRTLMPIWGMNTNFTSCFIAFYLTIPFWNILIKGMTQRQHISLLALLLGCYSILGTVPDFYISFNYVTWFGVIYLLASYVRLYPLPIFSKTYLWGWATLLSVVMALASMYVMLKIYGSNGAQYFVNDSNRFLAVLVAFCSFLWFKNINLPYSKLINTIGASTFGVLLIHANSDAMRTWLWKDTVACVEHYGLPLTNLVLYSVGSISLIFAVCILIDVIRIRVIETPFFRWFDSRFRQK